MTDTEVHFQIQGVVSMPEGVTPEAFLDSLIRFIEHKRGSIDVSVVSIPRPASGYTAVLPA